MQYFGGKFRQAKAIAAKILETSHNPFPLLSPFCGACNVEFELARMTGKPVRCSDANADMIALWQKLKDEPEWEPPRMSKERHAELKASNEVSAERGWAGSALSFAGVWFGGYASNRRGDDFHRNGIGSLRKQRHLLPLLRFSVATVPFEIPPDVRTLYLDPPYAGTANGYSHRVDCDFWDWVKTIKQEAFISEYLNPAGLPELIAKQRDVGVTAKKEEHKRRPIELLLYKRPG